MEIVQFLRWKLRCDPAATQRAYSQVGRGGPESCGCHPCLNFAAQRHKIYPPQVLQLLDQLGVDPTREVEVAHTVRLDNGLHSYSGWFHLVGEILEGDDCWREVGPESDVLDLEPVTELFSAGFSSDRSLSNEAFGTQPIVQFEFSTEAPWVSTAPEPE